MLIFSNLEVIEYKYYKPIIDLFIYYINCAYGKELDSLKFLSSLSDMTMPHNWFPEARSLNRKVYYHMGPTNSGKTHGALQALIKAKTGIYCAPLRLLAWEIQDKLLKNKVKCTLKTGQENVHVENATHFSCTVEICPTNIHYECAVIDEIQLIADPYRGSAWTNAFLGVKADEIHVCGDERALGLIYKLCELTGDSLIKKTYTRLSDLVVDDEYIHSVSQLKKGDCIIAFSKREIFELKNIINRKKILSKTKEIHNHNFLNKCALIYGSLPPETKKIQAYNFNHGKEGIKFLVATDAIGMGLNLNIKRIIFAQLTKRDQTGPRQLTEYEIKQIAGRAGRSDNIGYVSAFRKKDLDFVRTCCAKKHKKENRNIMEEVMLNYDSDGNISINEVTLTENECLIEKACLFPPLATIKEFADSFYKFKNKSDNSSINNEKKSKKKDINYISLSETLKQFENLSRISDLYFIRNLSAYYEIHEIIEDIKEANIETQYFFTICPIRITPYSAQNLKFFLKQFVTFGVVKLPQNYHLESSLFTKSVYKTSELSTFESIYNVLEIYVWLSYKYEKEFIERELAKVLKDRVSRIIESILQNSDFDIFSDIRTEKFESKQEETKEYKHANKERKLLPDIFEDTIDIETKTDEEFKIINE